MSILEHFKRVAPPVEQNLEVAAHQAVAVAEGDSSSSEEEPEVSHRPANPRKRTLKQRKSYTNAEKATVVKWCEENGKSASDAAQEFNYKPRLVQSK